MLQKQNDSQNDLILYTDVGGELKIHVRVRKDSVWLSQKQMAEIFGCSIDNVMLHLKNIYTEGELIELATSEESSEVQTEGGRQVRRTTKLYNLDAIISVGYRINSHRGTQFRIWATRRLREYIIKGFAMDDARLANGGVQSDFFKEWLARVRAIHASERNLYEKMRDVFATSVDYDPRVECAKEFFATVQNKFHFAITGFTAAELIVARIDGADEHLGLTTWSGDRPTRADAQIAKNYMIPTELRQLYLLVEQFLSHAEFQIERRRLMHMEDWKRKLNAFLQLNEVDVLDGAGSVSHAQMEARVKNELQKFLT